MRLSKSLSLVFATLALGAFSLALSNIALATETNNTITVENHDSSCIATDLKGHFSYSGNHMSDNPVTGSFDNIATNDDCPDDVVFHVFGSNNVPETGDWLNSQTYLFSKSFDIQAGQTDQDVSLWIPQDNDFCWYQVDATRTHDVKNPPTYNGDDMIDYVFVHNDRKDSCNENEEETPTPTATPSASVTPTEAPTATPTPGSSNSSSSSNNSTPTQTVAGIQETLSTTSMAGTGTFMQDLMNLFLGLGMIVLAVGAILYVKEKKV